MLREGAWGQAGDLQSTKQENVASYRRSIPLCTTSGVDLEVNLAPSRRDSLLVVLAVPGGVSGALAAGFGINSACGQRRATSLRVRWVISKNNGAAQLSQILHVHLTSDAVGGVYKEIARFLHSEWTD